MSDNIPKQVREQAEESERLMKEQKALKDDSTLEPAIPGKPNDKTTTTDPENWEKRFIGFKKIYDEEVPALRTDLSQKNGQVEVLTQQVADLLKQLQAKPVDEPASPTVDNNASLQERIAQALTEEEKGQYEENFIGMIARMIESVQNTAPNNNLESRVKNVEKVQHQSAGEKFWATIKKELPDWKEIQKADKFQLYLNQYDPLLQSTRLDVLKQAQSDLDAERAIAVFMNYKNGSQYEPVGDDPIVIDPLEKHIVPDVTGGGDGGDIEVVPNLSLEDITQFYVDVSLGRYSARPSEQASMESAIRKIHEAAQPQAPHSVENKTEY